jgi:hypothetical protein
LLLLHFPSSSRFISISSFRSPSPRSFFHANICNQSPFSQQNDLFNSVEFASNKARRKRTREERTEKTAKKLLEKIIFMSRFNCK